MGHTVDFSLIPPHHLSSCAALQDLNHTKAQLYMNRLLRNPLMTPKKLAYDSCCDEAGMRECSICI